MSYPIHKREEKATPSQKRRAQPDYTAEEEILAATERPFNLPQALQLPTPHNVLRLQRLIGNQAVQRLLIQRQTGEETISPSFTERLQAARSDGQPLASPVRDSMESAFDADFRAVRVHTDAEADQLNQTLQSHAFTTGQDIFFLAGKYAPESQSGQKLLAHELAHTRQKDAHNRIACWAPDGHRIVTEKAFQDQVLAALYAEEVRKILAARAPDMDFIQDQQNDMNQGIRTSDANIKTYKTNVKNLSKHPELKASLNEAWLNNTLHVRDTNYMRMHGEGGEYRMTPGDAAGINRAVTVEMIDKAVALYQAGTTDRAIEVLSDVLHQAEDRGSHSEGAQGVGHDARQKVSLKQRAPDHRGVFQTVPAIPYSKAPHPDDSDVNKTGAQKAIGYAQDVLYRFAAAVGQIVTAVKPAERHAVIKGFETTSHGKASGVGGTFAKALRTGRHIRGLGPLAPEKREGLGGVVSTQQSRDALAYYLGGVQRQSTQDAYREAKQTFARFAKSRLRSGGKSKTDRISESKNYYHGKVDPLLTQAKDRAESIKQAYREVFLAELAADPDYPGGTMQAEIWSQAMQRFWEIDGQEVSKEEKTRQCQAYYQSIVQPWHEQIELLSGAIQRAYTDTFHENLFA